MGNFTSTPSAPNRFRTSQNHVIVLNCGEEFAKGGSTTQPPHPNITAHQLSLWWPRTGHCRPPFSTHASKEQKSLCGSFRCIQLIDLDYHAAANYWAVIWGGAKLMGIGKRTRERALPKTFGPPPKQLLVCSVVDFCTGKNRALTLEGGWKPYRTRFSTPLFFPPPHGVL